MLLKFSDHFSQQEPEEWFHISGDQQSPVKLPQNTQTLQNRPSSLVGSCRQSSQQRAADCALKFNPQVRPALLLSRQVGASA